MFNQREGFLMTLNELPKREEVKVELTWDLTPIYESDEKWEAAFDEAQSSIKEAASKKGTLDDGATSF